MQGTTLIHENQVAALSGKNFPAQLNLYIYYPYWNNIGSLAPQNALLRSNNEEVSKTNSRNASQKL